jgi:hypothetical protein
MENELRSEPQAFTIAQFCARNGIGLGLFHKLKGQGRAPRLMVLGRRKILISLEAEQAWHAARENPDSTEAALLAREAERRSAIGRRAGTLAAASPRHVSKRQRSA